MNEPHRHRAGSQRSRTAHRSRSPEARGQREPESDLAPEVGHFQLPLDVLEGAIFGARWGQALVTRKLACSKGGFKL